MLRKKSFIVYRRVFITIVKIKAIFTVNTQKSHVCVCCSFFLSGHSSLKMKLYFSVILYIREQYTQGINNDHQECESNFKHKNDGQETFLLYMPNLL